MFEKLKDFLKVNSKAFTAILVGSIMAIETSGYRSVDNVLGSTDWLRDVSHNVRSS
jgi:hypothetical protein